MRRAQKPTARRCKSARLTLDDSRDCIPCPQPFITPNFLRRNEVCVPVDETASLEDAP